MFKKLSVLALLAPLIAALTVEVPQNPKSSSPVTIRWDSQAGDPATFSIYLVNEVFHDSFGIANNVVPENGEITLTLPVVPARDGYTINLVDVGNINNVFASSATFSVGEATASDTTSATGSSTGTGTTSGRSTSTSSTVPVTPRPTTSSSSFGVTVTPPSTPPTSSATNSTSSADSSATPTSAASAPLKMNTNIGTFAAVLFSAVAGAVVVAL